MMSRFINITDEALYWRTAMVEQRPGRVAAYLKIQLELLALLNMFQCF